MNKWILLVLLCTNLLSCSSLTTEGDLAEVKEFPRFHKRPVLVRIYRQFDGLLDDRKAHSYYMPDKNLEIRVKKALHKMNLFSSVELIQIPEQKTETSFEFKVVENRIRPTRFEFKKYGEILDIVGCSNHKLVNKPTNPI
ncbi:MAG: hypothetical protein HOM21_14850, partial [Halobacteriovoraceae bacterium]|nr:hypothetical protein [Halobacteriovoraceae bacterium]